MSFSPLFCHRNLEIALLFRRFCSSNRQKTHSACARRILETHSRNRYDLGLSVNDARNVASDLFEIASERNEAITRTGKYANDAVIAPKALRWLNEKEEKILNDITKKASEAEWDTEYTGSNPDLAARAARRASYADIDDSAATEQIEELIKNNVKEAKKIAALSGIDGAGFAGSSAALAWFMKNVPANKPMDYKNPIIWGKSLPGLPYPEEDPVYHAFGIDISSSDLGNLNYALVGKALGIPETLLLQQAGAASLRDHGGEKFLASQYHSLFKDDYGDENQDQRMIKSGFGVYKSLF